jgi:epoxyqueuosine reductase QueG
MIEARHDTTLAQWITDLIRQICAGPENALGGAFDEPAWGAPLVGFAKGDDPLFAAYKEHVGPEHWTPAEIHALTYPDEPAPPAELSVVSWVLPQTEATKADNRREALYLAERWARSRVFGEQFNNSLKRQVAEALTARGYPAVAPGISPLFKSVDSERFVYASTWSERHAAYAAGLGTFGLSDGLITPVGKAMRVGSVVVRASLPPSPRTYTDHHAYCLFYAQGTCGECIKRCPVGAITEAGHDKRLCRAHLDRSRPHVRDVYGFDGYGCGLCQAGVPCESGIPEGLGGR